MPRHRRVCSAIVHSCVGCVRDVQTREYIASRAEVPRGAKESAGRGIVEGGESRVSRGRGRRGIGACARRTARAECHVREQKHHRRRPSRAQRDNSARVALVVSVGNTPLQPTAPCCLTRAHMWRRGSWRSSRGPGRLVPAAAASPPPPLPPPPPSPDARTQRAGDQDVQAVGAASEEEPGARDSDDAKDDREGSAAGGDGRERAVADRRHQLEGEEERSGAACCTGANRAHMGE